MKHLKLLLNRIQAAPVFVITLLFLFTFAVLFFLLPKESFSQLENRVLSSPPNIKTWLTSEISENTEQYLADHFPLRNASLQLYAATAMLMGEQQHDDLLIGQNGWLYEKPPAQLTRSGQSNASLLSEMAEEWELPFTLVLIPTSAQNTAHLPLFVENADQYTLIHDLYSLAEPVQTIEPELSGDECYYRTDHHLTAKGTARVRKALLEAWSIEPLADIEPVTIDGFLGSYYTRLPSLLIPSEVFSAQLPSDVSLTVDGSARSGLLDENALKGSNKYAAVISQTYAHAILTGPGKNGVLLMIGDSYMNILAPSLARYFSRVDVIDPRYFTGDINEIIHSTGTTQILCCYGINTFLSDRSLALLDW